MNYFLANVLTTLKLMTRANGSWNVCKIWEYVGDKKKKIDRGGTIGCEIIVLRRGYKKADILSVNNFCLILNNRRTGQSYNIFCLRLFDTWDK